MGLDQFLDAAAARPFRDGEHDCLLWLADWVRELTGVDTAQDLRGRYRTSLGQARYLKANGGPQAVVEQRAQAAGLVRLETPAPGAVGVLAAFVAPARCGVVGGIYTGRRWAILARRGLLLVKADPIAAWGLA